MRAKDQKNLVRVGIFISILIAVLMIFVISIGKGNSLFDMKVQLKAHVTTAANLKPGAFVELKGIRIGQVDAVEIVDHQKVEILLTVREKDLQWIKSDSRINISTAGLVGDKFLEITGGTPEARNFKPSKDVLVSDEALDFKKFMNKGENIADTLARVLAKVEAILNGMDEGKKITSTMENIEKVSANLEEISNEIKDAKIGQSINGMSKSMNKMASTMDRVDRITQRIEEGPGTLNSFIYDDGAHEDLRALLGGAERNKVIKYFIRESIKAKKKSP